ncbi:hypothetical protein CDG61_10895 [Acinetobacter sp. WCHAc010052]|nr:hypothetical protein CDG61_10895 [Acinetobacter sp. WCHAc010052]
MIYVEKLGDFDLRGSRQLTYKIFCHLIWCFKIQSFLNSLIIIKWLNVCYNIYIFSYFYNCNDELIFFEYIPKNLNGYIVVIVNFYSLNLESYFFNHITIFMAVILTASV